MEKGLKLDIKNFMRILTLCKESDKLETGGILVGHYTRSCDQAIITKVIDAPEDSLKRRNVFVRGIKCLKKLPDVMWPMNNY